MEQQTSIREARQRAGLSQLKLCARADLSIKTVATAERWGPSAVSPESLRKIAGALGVSPEQLSPLDELSRKLLDELAATMVAK